MGREFEARRPLRTFSPPKELLLVALRVVEVEAALARHKIALPALPERGNGRQRKRARAGAPYERVACAAQEVCTVAWARARLHAFIDRVEWKLSKCSDAHRSTICRAGGGLTVGHDRLLCSDGGPTEAHRRDAVASRPHKVSAVDHELMEHTGAWQGLAFSQAW